MTVKYVDMTLGKIEAIVDKLGGLDAVERLLVGELVVRPLFEPTFKVWKTIRIGNFESTQKYREALKQAGHGMDMLTLKFIEKCILSKKEEELDLVYLSVGDLGFKEKTGYDNVCERAKKLGLELLPAEAGLALRLAYMHQPEDECLFIAMEPFIDTAGDPHIFCLSEVDPRSSLCTKWFLPTSTRWRIDRKFSFRLPRKFQG